MTLGGSSSPRWREPRRCDALLRMRLLPATVLGRCAAREVARGHLAGGVYVRPRTNEWRQSR